MLLKINQLDKKSKNYIPKMEYFFSILIFHITFKNLHVLVKALIKQNTRLKKPGTLLP